MDLGAEGGAVGEELSEDRGLRQGRPGDRHRPLVDLQEEVLVAGLPCRAERAVPDGKEAVGPEVKALARPVVPDAHLPAVGDACRPRLRRR